MKAYRLGLADYPKSSWAIHDVSKPIRRKKNPEMAPVFYKFFSTLDAEVEMRELYRPLQCTACGRFETDAVFERGFPQPPTIRFAHDIGLTDDRIYVINDKCLEALQQGEVAGYETKPIGDSGWHALNITMRVESDKSVTEHRGKKCKECGLPDESGGSVWNATQISVPDHPNTLFTTKEGRPAGGFADRFMYFTEGVLKALKEGKVKGPYCDLLFTAADLEKMEEKQKQGVKNCRPPGATVYLSGK